MSRPATPPVVVIGMHRSGTSLLSRMLGDLGVDMGLRRDANEESRLYLRLNEWLLHEAGAAWFAPAAFRRAADNPDFVRLAVASLRRATSMPLSVEHHGLRPSSLWGFKDPRTTITWPVWREVHPGSRVVLMRRNGLDVARSLTARAERVRAGAGPRLTAVLGVGAPRSGFRSSWAASDINQALELWSAYCDLEDEVAVSEPGAVRLRYEELLAAPGPSVARLADSLGLHPTRRQLAAATDRVGLPRDVRPPLDGLDPSRAASLLERHGYAAS